MDVETKIIHNFLKKLCQNSEHSMLSFSVSAIEVDLPWLRLGFLEGRPTEERAFLIGSSQPPERSIRRFWRRQLIVDPQHAKIKPGLARTCQIRELFSAPSKAHLWEFYALVVVGSSKCIDPARPSPCQSPPIWFYFQPRPILCFWERLCLRCSGAFGEMQRQNWYSSPWTVEFQVTLPSEKPHRLLFVYPL